MTTDKVLEATRMKMNQVKLTGPLHYVVHEQDFTR
jgi:hypothetical protein